MSVRYLSPAQIALALGISRSKAYRLLGSLPRVHIGRCVRVSEVDLEKYMQKLKEKPWESSISDTGEDSSMASTTPPKESESENSARSRWGSDRLPDPGVDCAKDVSATSRDS